MPCHGIANHWDKIDSETAVPGEERRGQAMVSGGRFCLVGEVGTGGRLICGGANVHMCAFRISF